ncbi:MAG TPA: radical SAM protein [Anaeromyxobacter sp.]|nr:radical SAM protein [Anaeromyxobacter sp.]
MSTLEPAGACRTDSLCPTCLARIPAQRVAQGEEVFLEKECRDHGPFRTVLWRGPPSYDSWAADGGETPCSPSDAPWEGGCAPGCPRECGLCFRHLRPTCCALLEVTSRCDLGCPFCFASSGGGGRDPGLPEIERRFRALLSSGRGPVNVQLSGGEPTLRDDLPEIIGLGRSLGFTFFQLNTNGLRLARDEAYLRRLREAGLSCVFLQFDGMSDAVHRRIRGSALHSQKLAAIDHCAEVGLGVVLVPTLVPGINTAELGAIVTFAAARGPAVRGVHFQPVSWFGRYPGWPTDADRITLPEVMRAIEEQTGGAGLASDLRPPSAENPHCSFSGSFLRTPQGTLARRGGGRLDRDRSPGCCPDPTRLGEVRRAREYVARRWVHPAPPPAAGCCCSSDPTAAALDRIIAEAAGASFCISGMAFQDAWTIDLARLRECFIHVAGPGGRVIPFCAYNLTSASGQPLHRRGEA